MPEPDTSKIIAFSTPEALGKWFDVNHATEQELWVKIYKKNSGILSVTWNDVVIEALCWGWIDGIKKSFDEQAYLQRITPRKKRSIWSKRNTEHVERLISEGRMKKPGMDHVIAAKSDGRWENAYKVSELQVPDDFIKAVAKFPKAQQCYESLTKASRNTIAYGLTSAKRPETRQRRFEKFITLLKRGEKPG